MPNAYFQFKQFLICQDKSGMKVTTDGCLFGAWVANNFVDSGLNRVLDIGTGTGLLTLMLAQKIDAQFDAVEVDAVAFEEASHNFQNSPWADIITCFQTSIQEFKCDDAFDLIICNPPFFKENKIGKSDTKNLAVHNLSLSMEDLISSVNQLLSRKGKLAMMYPEWEMSQFSEMAQDIGLWPEQVLNVYNHRGSKVFRVLSVFSGAQKSVLTDDIVIRHEGSYSKEFQRLVEDYYL